MSDFSEALGRPVEGSATPRRMLRLAGLARPEARELADIISRWDAPFVSSDAAFESAFGPLPVTPLAEAVAGAAAWFEAQLSGASESQGDREVVGGPVRASTSPR